jgi:hypothetical protein
LGTLVFETYRRGSRGAVGTARTEGMGRGIVGRRFVGAGRCEGVLECNVYN